MEIAPVAEIKARFSAYLKESKDGSVVVTRNGRAVAVLLSVADEDEIERLALAYSPKFQSILRRAKRQIREEGGVQHDDFWRDMENETN